MIRPRPAHARRPVRRRGERDETGQTTAFVVITTVALILLVGLVLDGGLVLDARLRALNTAQAAARAGAQAIDLQAYRTDADVVLDPAHARSAASAYLADAGVDGTVTVRGNTVTVTVRQSQQMQILQLAGLGALEVSGTATAHPVPGIVEPLS